MRARVQWALRITTRRRQRFPLAASLGKPAGMRRRRAWARSVEQLLNHASRYPPSQIPHPHCEAMLQTRVVLACRSALLAIKQILADQRQPISVAALRQLQTFLTDPSASPLFGDNPFAAQHAARQLQHSFTRHPASFSVAPAACSRPVLYRSVAIAMVAAGIVLLAVGIAYLVTQAYGLPPSLPHDAQSMERNVKAGSVAILAGAFCFLGARLTSRRAVRTRP
jgi:hypothetical protein